MVKHHEKFWVLGFGVVVNVDADGCEKYNQTKHLANPIFKNGVTFEKVSRLF